MSAMIGNPLLLPTEGYEISRSVRTRGAYPATPSYFSRTAGTPTNNLKWTFSFWAKRGVLSVGQQILNAGTGTSASEDYLTFLGSNKLAFYQGNGTTTVIATDAVFRDPSAWYHIVLVYDSAQATASNRLFIYVNGVSQSFSSSTYPTLNQATNINSNGVLQRISSRTYLADEGFDGYLTETNFIDGQALTPSSFGETDAITGVWKPKKYAGTYGTNGFYLNFSDNSAATATTIGKDFSGNGNNWTPTNISVTAGVTYDSMTDVPTLNSPTAANYAVLNSAIRPYTVTSVEAISAGNLQISNTGSGVTGSGWSTFNVTTGKWYYETNVLAAGGNIWIGVSNNANAAALGTYNAALRDNGYTYKKDGNKCNNSATGTAYGATYTTNDIVGVALDLDASTIEFFKNGVSQGVAFTGITSTGGFTPGVSVDPGTTTVAINFGQRPFSYTPPTGFKALNTQNLPASTIVNGAAYMAATLYTGTSVAQSIVNTVNGVSFQPDLVWGKNRTNVNSHRLTDVNRGVGKVLFSDTTNGDTTGDGQLSSFNSNGFGLTGGAGSFEGLNQSGNNYVAWQWKANGTAVTNTAGSITSQVSAGVTQGFSVVTASASGTSPVTVGHGLGVAPRLIIGKVRDVAGTNWYVYNANIAANDYLVLNSTAAKATSSNIWDIAPTSTVFTVGNPQNGWAAGSAGSKTYVFYCFSEVAGFSKIGSYTGNGSADGPFVFCGFRPRFVMLKRTDAAGDWQSRDISRDPVNGPNGNALFPNLSNAETASLPIDYLSNGFKIRDTGAFNTSGATYVFVCFAENPFKNSLAR